MLHRSLLIGHYLRDSLFEEISENNLYPFFSVTTSKNVRRTCPQCMPGKVFSPRARENMAVDTRHIL